MSDQIQLTPEQKIDLNYLDADVLRAEAALIKAQLKRVQWLTANDLLSSVEN